jgi:hypothetical protein
MLKLVNVDRKDKCYKTAIGYNDPLKFEIKPKDIFFTGLFNIFPAPENYQIQTINSNQSFEFKWQPALDTQVLIDEGITDETVQHYLEGYLGDFVLISLKDGFNHSVICKAPDAVLGSYVIPSKMLKKMYGKTGFHITRYKVKREIISSTLEFRLIMKVRMYSHYTDLFGNSSGLSINIE